MRRPTLLILAAIAAVAEPGASLAQLPGIGLPSVELPRPMAPPPTPAPRPSAGVPPRVPPKAALPVVEHSAELAGPAALPVVPPTTHAPWATGDLLDAVPLGGDYLSAVTAVAGDDGSSEVILRAGEGATAALGREIGALGSYRSRARDLLRRHADALEPDDRGRPVVRGEVTVVGATSVMLRRARAAGFRLRSRERIEGLDLDVAVLEPPRRLAGPAALARLRALDPDGRYDLNHVYLEGAAAAAPSASRGPSSPPAASGRGLRIGLVDATADRAHPALARTPMTQRAFAAGGAHVTSHATAIASLLAGDHSSFRGAAPGAALYVADVYGTTPAGGSALALARGLGWLAAQQTPVINISLVGPPNALLEAAIAKLIAKGHLVVAAVGNDGPAADPLYPAAYPGVVAVTGVDARRRPLPEAGRGTHVAFAAPGADMIAAFPGGELRGVRGTSFAAPLAAGRLAALIRSPGREAARRAVAVLAREAADLGPPGRDPLYGRGLVAFDLAVRPTPVTARRRPD